jgi:uncharacterized protein (DUF433 family)
MRRSTTPTGRRRTPDVVLDLLAAGVSEKEILEDFPDLEERSPDGLTAFYEISFSNAACLQYAAARYDQIPIRPRFNPLSPDR